MGPRATAGGKCATRAAARAKPGPTRGPAARLTNTIPVKATITRIAQHHTGRIPRIATHNTHPTSARGPTQLRRPAGTLRHTTRAPPGARGDVPQGRPQARLMEPPVASITQQHPVMALRPTLLTALARRVHRGRRCTTPATAPHHAATSQHQVSRRARGSGATIRQNGRPVSQHARHMPAHDS